jgi:hypothetical protein
MPVIGCRDDDRVEAGRFQKTAMVVENLSAGRTHHGFVGAPAPEIAYGSQRTIQFLEYRLKFLMPAGAAADQPDRYAIVGAHYAGTRRSGDDCGGYDLSSSHGDLRVVQRATGVAIIGALYAEENLKKIGVIEILWC